MKKLLTFLSVIVVLTLVFIPSFSQGLNIKNQDFKVLKQRYIMADDFDNLKLTVEQKEKIEDLRAENQKKMIELRYKLNIAHFDFQQIMRKNPDEKVLLKKVEEINSIKLEMEKERIKNHFKIRGILTDEQKKIFDLHFGQRLWMGNGNENGRGMMEGYHNRFFGNDRPFGPWNSDFED